MLSELTLDPGIQVDYADSVEHLETSEDLNILKVWNLFLMGEGTKFNKKKPLDKTSELELTHQNMMNSSLAVS